MLEEKVLLNSGIYYWTNRSESERSILFLHPAFADHTCFDDQIQYFRDYKLLIPDLLGHGKSLGRGTIGDTTEHLVEMLNAENVEKINIVGVSIGAVLAQDFANKNPEKVASLCCIGGYDINNFDQAMQKDSGKTQMKLMLLGFLSIRKFAEENKKISAYTPNAQARYYQMALGFQKSSFRYLSTLGTLINQHKTTNRPYPLMIGVGKHDNQMALKASTLWAEDEPAAHFILFPDAGHIVNMDAPDHFNKELAAFLP